MRHRPGASQQIIVIQRPALWVGGMFALFVLVLLSIWLAWEYGRYSAGYDHSDAEDIIFELQSKLKATQAELVASRRQAAMLERNHQIDEDAARALQQELVAERNASQALKKELAFYKSIVSPEQGKRHLVIQTFELTPREDGRFHYRLMVSQRGRNDRYARGVIALSASGVRQGKPVTLALETISNANKKRVKALKFGFKYFQNFEGDFALPEDFAADAITVKVKPRTGKLKAVDKQFEWESLVRPEQSAITAGSRVSGKAPGKE